MYIETSQDNSGNEKISVSFERTDFIQIIKIAFYYNTGSILTNDSFKLMGRFRIQLLSKNMSWSTRYKSPKDG